MAEILPETSDSSLRFPDPRKEAAARAREFREMSDDQRTRSLREVLGTGIALVKASPKRAVIEEIHRKREAEWQRIQRELFADAE